VFGLSFVCERDTKAKPGKHHGIIMQNELIDRAEDEDEDEDEDSDRDRSRGLVSYSFVSVQSV
jgi:hypothetical protein